MRHFLPAYPQAKQRKEEEMDSCQARGTIPVPTTVSLNHFGHCVLFWEVSWWSATHCVAKKDLEVLILLCLHLPDDGICRCAHPIQPDCLSEYRTGYLCEILRALGHCSKSTWAVLQHVCMLSPSLQWLLEGMELALLCWTGPSGGNWWLVSRLWHRFGVILVIFLSSY